MKLRVRRDDAQAREGGFTLVEMVVTITIIGALFLSVSTLLNSSLRSLAAAKSRARANDFATSGIEDLQRFSFNNLGVCVYGPTTAPAGLETPVEFVGCPAGDVGETGALFEDPCKDPEGTVPRKTYTCTRNNVTYTVKRYVAWADELKTTKRLAVYVEWTDLAGNHQVSQQSSLRAPDQSAILGLAPPKFTAVPSVRRYNGSTETPTDPVLLTDTRHVASPYKVRFEAVTTKLHKAALAYLQSPVTPHAQNDTFTINVSTFAGFPTYNGYSVTVDNETFKVLSGAGTPTWRVQAGATSQHSPGAEVRFGGDRVYATVQTIGSNNHPEPSTVLMDTMDGLNWTAEILSGTTEYVFGSGTQYVSFGILRSADGKTTSAFSDKQVEFCPSANPTCAGIAKPLIDNVSVSPGSVALGASGALQNDITVTLRTTNITRSDTVTVSFLTQSGTQTVVLAHDANAGTCPLTTTTPDFTCNWVGKIPRTAGYRFTPGSQPLYFAAQQVLDVDPTSVDQASMGIYVHPSVTFTS
jgi:prepilin-type N-terminal cleavage/methylation domain-containing protein